MLAPKSDSGLSPGARALIYSSVKWGLRQHTDHRNEETHRKPLVERMVHNKGLFNISGCCYHHHDFQVIPCSNPPHGKPCSAIWSRKGLFILPHTKP